MENFRLEVKILLEPQSKALAAAFQWPSGTWDCLKRQGLSFLA